MGQIASLGSLGSKLCFGACDFRFIEPHHRSLEVYSCSEPLLRLKNPQDKGRVVREKYSGIRPLFMRVRIELPEFSERKCFVQQRDGESKRDVHRTGD